MGYVYGGLESFPENLLKIQEFCRKSAKFFENLNFAIWKNMPLSLH